MCCGETTERDAAGQIGWRHKCLWARGLGGDPSEELKNPNPVSGAGPSILRGLFHPNASKLTSSHCVMVSAVLNLG